MMRAEDPDATFEQMAVIPKELTRYDDWLSEALNRVIKGDIKNDVAMKEQEMSKAGKPMTGLQMLYMFHRDFDVEAEKTQLCGVTDLIELRDSKPNDSSLHRWYTTWLAPAGAQADSNISDSTLKEILWDAVEKSTLR